MPTPSKPCAGTFSEQTLQALTANTDRAQWNSQRCDLCGQMVGARLIGVKWSPEQHWPSVAYAPRGKNAVKRPKTSKAASPEL